LGKPNIVQCKECGNLCVHNVDTGEDVPMSRLRRDTGDPTDFEIKYCEAIPICAVRMPEFAGDDESLSAGRSCDKFVQFEPGLMLERYTEMRLLETVKAENRKHQMIMYVLTGISVVAAVISAIANSLR
jgi:hypothetical protein